MAAFCHPHPGGGRFNDASRGAWYAGFSIATAHAEAIHHRTRELEEIGGWFDTYVQMAAYLADFDGEFHDLRDRRFAAYMYPNSYRRSQQLGRKLLRENSSGIVYPSVRHRGGTCITCFRPRLVLRVRQGGFYEYRWSGSRHPAVRKI
jgi:RES domain-containing protein